MENETNDLRMIIAKNITDLRKQSNLTQLELADRLNYTDKAVSKWERGESVPDIVILKRISELFGVTVDYLISEEHGEVTPKAVAHPRWQKKRTHGFIIGLSIVLVWLLATVAFVAGSSIFKPGAGPWLSFVIAVPVSMVVWLVLNSIWFNRRLNYLIVSILMWSVLATLHLSLFYVDMNFWMLYLLGVPGQVLILLWSRIGKKK